LRSQVLKVPHHGSATSSTTDFVAAIEPRLAIVSVANHDRFGLPHARVLETYRTSGAFVLRTDRDGAIIIEITLDGTITVNRGRRSSKDELLPSRSAA
jgi:competence protein ComEC